MIFLVFSPVFWVLKSLVLYFILLVALTAAWRSYKILWARRNRRPVSSRELVLITGATSGIGLALAKHLYRIGYSIVIGYYDSRERGYHELKQVAKEKSGNQKMIFVELDVRSQKSISAAYDTVASVLTEHKLQLFGLINNAGLGSLQPLAFLQRDIIKSLVETNLLGTLLMVREFLPLIVKARGRVINVSSGLAFLPGATYATYGATKVAQLYLTRCLNMEMRTHYNIKSVSIIPYNLIKHTNISALNAKNNEDAWAELKGNERQLYADEYSQHCRLTRRLEEATKDFARVTTSSKKSEGSSSSKSNYICRLLSVANFFARIKGGAVALTLEQSGVLECFEDALRLDDPPEHMFAGDNFYNLLIGSILLSIPTSCIGLLSRSVARSLYR